MYKLPDQHCHCSLKSNEKLKKLRQEILVVVHREKKPNPKQNQTTSKLHFPQLPVRNILRSMFHKRVPEHRRSPGTGLSRRPPSRAAPAGEGQQSAHPRPRLRPLPARGAPPAAAPASALPAPPPPRRSPAGAPRRSSCGSSTASAASPSPRSRPTGPAPPSRLRPGPAASGGTRLRRHSGPSAAGTAPGHAGSAAAASPGIGHGSAPSLHASPRQSHPSPPTRPPHDFLLSSLMNTVEQA